MTRTLKVGGSLRTAKFRRAMLGCLVVAGALSCASAESQLTLDAARFATEVPVAIVSGSHEPAGFAASPRFDIGSMIADTGLKTFALAGLLVVQLRRMQRRAAAGLRLGGLVGTGPGGPLAAPDRAGEAP